ncbi:hypothetical protein [Micromonospora mirobrigensis]|uniref:Tryptophan-associated transmembrane protein (Trp_oprn_chp) n=1 Tax=Micromonospora mirobrigensis TaxID=262898 RepID=A0A1C5AD87_9ACTN|nr:hypothetical protein [Micromonospora mirobrigensis]SCF43031.1 hypothetical protein GA0070564_10949 [Micromonospora mirobrigensis]
MSQDLPIPRQDNRSDGTAVVEWGPTGSDAPTRTGRPLVALARDRRVPLILAGLGAAAAVASLVGEWLVMTVPNGGPEGGEMVRVPGGVAEVGGFGVGYLVGLLGLAAALALALAGTPGVRRNARVAGLALAGTVLAVLTAAALSLDDSGERTLFYSSEDGFRVEYGRGLVMAFLATALLAGALQLTGLGAAGRGPVDVGPEEADDEPVPVADHGRWQRVSARPDLPSAPADLTVEPAAPFARPDNPA